MKPSESDSAYSALPPLSRRALYTHYSAARDRLCGIEKSFARLVQQRIESCNDDDCRADAFWECFDDVLSEVSVLSQDMLKSYREILVANIEGSLSIGEAGVKQFIVALETTAAEFIKDTINRVPRWLKFASDGELFTQEDIRFIDERRREWSVHSPDSAEDFRSSFETDCRMCGSRVRKLASHLGGAEFDIPTEGEGNWVRHECYSDISRIMRELLHRWVVPSWFIQSEFVGGTVPVPYRRVDSTTGKTEELEPLKIPVAEKVTREVRSDMERDVREVMLAIAGRENRRFIHESALILAKRARLSPLSPTAAGHALVPLRDLRGAQLVWGEIKAPGEAPQESASPLENSTQSDMAITEKTYFVTEAEALNSTQDRPGQLVAAYSTNDPYLRDLALLCFSDSATGLLEKLEKIQADHQKLLIHWGESEEELEQLPDVLKTYLSLKETSKTVRGRHIDDAVQNLRSFFESDRKKRGRPRQDALSRRVQELRRSDHSWGEIRILLNKETGIDRTANAYRNLLRSRRKPEDA
jgi:hypothetical protein